ncbi:hypothetical protein KDA23_01970, partial [Candidatus Saccharibacteria bacterium]|nr:hypothetical protein [Candidatus Saccharibacteria bacterium]
MIKKTKKRLSEDGGEIQGHMTRRTRAVVLLAMTIVGIGAIALAVWTIIIMPRTNPGAQRGVSASGFTAFVEQDSDLGMGTVVKKEDVKSVLGNKSKSVSDVVVSKVMNLDGNRGQTATYPFVRADGKKASVYVDVMLFKNQAALDAANVTKNTLKGGMIGDLPAYYLHALTLGSDREYRLLVIKGLNVY